LDWFAEEGYDLKSPNKETGFKGLKDGDVWCVDANWWKFSLEFGNPNPIYLDRTHS